MTSALIIYNNDIDMLKLQVESGQFANYDKIYIADGPYEYVLNRPLLSNKVSRLDETGYGQSLLRDKRIVYDFRVWSGEADKRVWAYNWVDDNLVILHDTDEFYDFREGCINEFLMSEFSVASFFCQNLYLNGYYFSNELYKVSSPNKLPQKNFVFKKSKVTAREHLDYLWLVGVEQSQPDKFKCYNQPLAYGYHLTQMRSESGQNQKYYFYSSLHSKKSNEKDVLEALNEDVLSGLIKEDEALTLFLRSIPEYLRVPSINSELIPSQRLKISNYLEDIVALAADESKTTQPPSFVVKSNLAYCMYFDSDSIPSSMVFCSNLDVEVQRIGYCLDIKPILTKNVYKNTNSIKIDPAGVNEFGVIIKIIVMSSKKFLNVKLIEN